MSQLDVMRFHFPTPIDFGVGARKKIIGELAERGLSKPLIVTDQGLAKLPLIHDYKVFLEGEGSMSDSIAALLATQFALK